MTNSRYADIIAREARVWALADVTNGHSADPARHFDPHIGRKFTEDDRATYVEAYAKEYKRAAAFRARRG